MRGSFPLDTNRSANLLVHNTRVRALGAKFTLLSERQKKKARCMLLPRKAKRSSASVVVVLPFGGLSRRLLRGCAWAGVWPQRRRGTYRCLSVVSPSRHCAALSWLWACLSILSRLDHTGTVTHDSRPCSVRLVLAGSLGPSQLPCNREPGF